MGHMYVWSLEKLPLPIGDGGLHGSGATLTFLYMSPPYYTTSYFIQTRNLQNLHCPTFFPSTVYVSGPLERFEPTRHAGASRPCY